MLGAVRRAGVQDLQLGPAVVAGDHRDGQVLVGGELDGQLAELGGIQDPGLLPDVRGVGAAEDGLADPRGQGPCAVAAPGPGGNAGPGLVRRYGRPDLE